MTMQLRRLLSLTPASSILLSSYDADTAKRALRLRETRAQIQTYEEDRRTRQKTNLESGREQLVALGRGAVQILQHLQREHKHFVQNDSHAFKHRGIALRRERKRTLISLRTEIGPISSSCRRHSPDRVTKIEAADEQRQRMSQKNTRSVDAVAAIAPATVRQEESRAFPVSSSIQHAAQTAAQSLALYPLPLEMVSSSAFSACTKRMNVNNSFTFLCPYAAV